MLQLAYLQFVLYTLQPELIVLYEFLLTHLFSGLTSRSINVIITLSLIYNFWSCYNTQYPLREGQLREGVHLSESATQHSNCLLHNSAAMKNRTILFIDKVAYSCLESFSSSLFKTKRHSIPSCSFGPETSGNSFMISQTRTSDTTSTTGTILFHGQQIARRQIMK